MTSKLKTKDSIKELKTKDNTSAFKHYVKEKAINAKSKNNNQETVDTPAEIQATSSIQHTAKETTILSTQHAKDYTLRKINKHKLQKQSKKELTQIRNKTKTIGKRTHSTSSTDIPSPSSSTNYSKRMKNLTISQYKTTIKNTNQIKQSTSVIKNTAMKTFKGSVAAVRKVVSSLSTLINLGIGGILLIVITLFIGVFSSLSSDSTINPGISTLSEEVLAHTATIEKYASQYEMSDYIALIQAIMMQESGGKGNDPMQSSESIFNEKYPKELNGITDPEYSIEVGIKTIYDHIKKASVKDSSDTEHIYLAIQAYNYGDEYIDWAVKNFGGYSKANAKLFSDTKKQELNLNTYGDPKYVEHVIRYITFGFGNIRAEPNFENMQAWGNNNPYSSVGLFGQCTWFAWGRFYEIYGYSPGFTGDGWKCAEQLVNAHPDKFELSSQPKVGAIYSAIGKNHVGIVISWDRTTITVQDGNLDNKTNTFQEAKKDWGTHSYTFDKFLSKYGGVKFANPK